MAPRKRNRQNAAIDDVTLEFPPANNPSKFRNKVVEDNYHNVLSERSLLFENIINFDQPNGGNDPIVEEIEARGLSFLLEQPTQENVTFTKEFYANWYRPILEYVYFHGHYISVTSQAIQTYLGLHDVDPNIAKEDEYERMERNPRVTNYSDILTAIEVSRRDYEYDDYSVPKNLRSNSLNFKLRIRMSIMFSHLTQCMLCTISQ